MKKKNPSQQVLNAFKMMQEEESIKQETNDININLEQLQALNTTIKESIEALNEANENFKKVKEGSEQAVQTICTAISTAHSSPVPVTIKAASLTKLETLHSNHLKSEEELLTAHEQRMQSMLDKQAKHLDRISVPQMLAYIMLTTTAVLLIGFTILITLNITQLHHETLSNTLWLIAGMLLVFNALIITATIWLRNRNL